MAVQKNRIEKDKRKPVIAVVLQGLVVGGMERCALQVARCATESGYDARLVLYDQPYNGSEGEYDAGDIPVTFIPKARGIDFSLPGKLASLFRRWKVAIVHARNNVASFYSAAAIALMGRQTPQLVITFDTLPADGTAKARMASRWASRRAARVTSVSKELAKRLVDSGWVTASEVIWNGVDTTEFTPSGLTYGLKIQLGLCEKTLLIGSVARIDQNKRQVDLLEALKSLRRNHHELALVLAGDGPFRSEVESRAAVMSGVSVIKRVVDVAAFLRELDVFVLCSDHEGCPRALLEAMACKKPIVATAVGGIPEILGNCGLLVPPRHPDLLAQAIGQMCDSNELRNRFGEAAHRRVLESFTLEQEWYHYKRVYESALRLS
jgi:glycosyltransferase involved in cell wall biosynthesis